MAGQIGSGQMVNETAPRSASTLAIELLGSMRFAVALLTVLCIASVVGTVLPQGQSEATYINQFGPFWTEVFKDIRLFQVYGSWWYLSILGFLILSTSLCVFKTTPKLFSEARGWKEHVREQSFRAFRLRGVLTSGRPDDELKRIAGGLLRSGGYACKEIEQTSGTLITAKKGAGNRWGFVLAHVGLVMIGIGALADGSFPVRIQMWLGQKRPAMTNAELGAHSLASVLSSANPTFRGSVFVPEGEEVGQALLPLDDGFLVQDLPFRLHLNQFRVDYYSSGMPRLFASDVTLIDKRTGKATSATIEVNKPYEMSGVMVYQSSFEDGGSQLSLRAIPTDIDGSTVDLLGVAGRKLDVPTSNGRVTVPVELTEFKAVNVEAMPNEGATSVEQKGRLESLLGAAGPSSRNEVMRNIGATLSYVVRDSAGQATEFTTVHRPMQVDGSGVFLFGVRKPGASSFQYVRIPADEKGELGQWLLLRKAFTNPKLKKKAVERYLASADERLDQATRARLKEAAESVLRLFAGDKGRNPQGGRGLVALTRYLGESVPESERGKMARALAKLLQGTTLALWNVAREEVGQTAVPQDERSLSFVALTLTSLSDLPLVDAPFLLSLSSYREVKASIFQVARAPGKYVVLLGAVGLTVGILLMFYLRSRRLFVWIPKENEESTGTRRVSVAMSSSRQSWDIHNDFEQLKRKLRAAMD